MSGSFDLLNFVVIFTRKLSYGLFRIHLTPVYTSISFEGPPACYVSKVNPTTFISLQIFLIRFPLPYYCRTRIQLQPTEKLSFLKLNYSKE